MTDLGGSYVPVDVLYREHFLRSGRITCSATPRGSVFCSKYPHLLYNLCVFALLAHRLSTLVNLLLLGCFPTTSSIATQSSYSLRQYAYSNKQTMDQDAKLSIVVKPCLRTIARLSGTLRSLILVEGVPSILFHSLHSKLEMTALNLFATGHVRSGGEKPEQEKALRGLKKPIEDSTSLVSEMQGRIKTYTGKRKPDPEIPGRCKETSEALERVMSQAEAGLKDEWATGSLS